jgi:ankyrin repeat protein
MNGFGRMKLKHAKTKSAMAVVVALSMLALSGCGLLDTAKNAIKQPSFQEQYDAAVFTNCDDLELVKEYVDADKANVNRKLPHRNAFLNTDVSPLYLVFSNELGRYEDRFAEYLLENGADPNIAYDDRTLLMCASGSEGNIVNTGLAALLLEYGADPNIKDGEGLTALDYAVKICAAENVRCILESSAAKISDETLSLARNIEVSGGDSYSICRSIFEAADRQGADYDEFKQFGMAVLGKTGELISEIKAQGGVYEADIPFYAAAYCGSEAMEFFVKQGVDINGKDSDGSSFLWISASMGNVGVVQYLVEKGVSLDFSSYSPLDYDPLSIAILNNHYDVAKYLLENGTRFNIDESLGYDGGIGDLGGLHTFPDDSFQCATYNGNISMVELLEDYNFPMNENTYYRAMKVAVVHGQSKALEYFLEKGADPNYVDNRFADNLALLDICAYEGDLETMKFLYEHGAVVKTDKSDALSDAVDAGNYDMAKFLLDNGMDVNSHQRFDDGSMIIIPWDNATSHGYFNIIKLLLEYGADIDGGHDPMIVTYAQGSERITKYLIDNGADVSAQNRKGNTALHVAALNHRTANAKALLAADADPSIKNDEGKTALDIAKAEGADEIVKLLEGAR